MWKLSNYYSEIFAFGIFSISLFFMDGWLKWFAYLFILSSSWIFDQISIIRSATGDVSMSVHIFKGLQEQIVKKIEYGKDKGKFFLCGSIWGRQEKKPAQQKRGPEFPLASQRSLLWLLSFTGWSLNVCGLQISFQTYPQINSFMRAQAPTDLRTL